MQLTILGSGSYIPELTRHCSSYLIKINKQILIFDFGRGALDQLMKLGINYYDIDYIFITHTHADHCSELASLLHIALEEQRKWQFRKKDLIIYGPKGLKETVKHILAAFHILGQKPKYKVEIKEITGEVSSNDWLVKSFEVKHSENCVCLAYRIESDNKVIAYSGDTGECPALEKAAKNADLAIIEASLPSELEKETHLTGETAGKIAAEANVKKLILTHPVPYYLKNFDPKKDAAKFYKGTIILAEDMMNTEI